MIHGDEPTQHGDDPGDEGGQAPPSDDDPLAPGDRVGDRWQVVRTIGRGASGTVLLARDAEGGEVALKVIHRERCGDPQVLARFRREARILSRVSSPHVVPLLDCVKHDDLVVLVLELARGRSLEAILAEHPDGLPPADAVDLAVQIGEGLAVAHAADVVHRDLKPANVVVEDDPARGRLVRILDFGLAKVMQGEAHMTAITDRGMIFGTAEYMAPEQARGDDVDARSDVYSLGVVLYEMLSGRVPFRERSPIATMTAHLDREVPPLRPVGSAPPSSDAPRPSVPRALEAVVMRALAKDPAARWPSARALVDALLAAQDQRRVVTRSSVDALELGETMPAGGTGALRRSQILRAAAEHARLAAEAKGRAELVATMPSAPATVAGGSPPDAARQRISVPPPSRAADEPHRRLWIAVAVVLALLCVGLGIVVGVR